MIKGILKKEKNRIIDSVNMTSMADILLTLLILFLSLETAQDFSGFKFKVSSSGSSKILKRSPLKIKLLKERMISIKVSDKRQEIIFYKDLKNILKSIKKDYKDKPVIIESPASFNYKEVVYVIDSLKGENFYNISLVKVD